MSLRRDVAFAGGAALAAGLLLVFMAERLRRFAPPAATRPVPVERAPADLLERYRIAAAV